MTLLHQAAQKAVEAKEREAFEAWARGPAGYVDDQLARYADGSYQDSTTLLHWSIWRAACKASRGVIAALQQQPEPVAPSVDAEYAHFQQWHASLKFREGLHKDSAREGWQAALSALQQQEVPREPVAWMCACGESKRAGWTHRRGWCNEGGPAAFEKAAASPSTTQQQEVGSGRALPHPGSPEASAMLDSLLAEYQWPANSKNAARAGWEAANRWLAAAPCTPENAEKDTSNGAGGERG